MTEDLLFLDRSTVLRCATGIDVVAEIDAALRDHCAVDDPGRGMERAGGVTLVFDPETARPRCMAVGCGTQATMHIDMMVDRFPALDTVYLFDLDRARTEAFAAATTRKHPRLRVVVSPSVQDAVGAAPVIITVTTSTNPYIPADWIAAGSFVAHMSLDDLTPGALLGAQALYVDDVDLIREIPQRILGHLLNEEPATYVTGTLGAVLNGTCPVVRPSGGYVVSNPFGMAILDVGLVAAVERRTRELGLGHVLELR